ncbi:hypothetical protein [Methylobacterium aquaticum]|uniref:Uncharacterized protein n=1 Tax=Methylobacterium aquaticum TaxID=270351 RepID=A0A0C6FXK4_9HYPH|nr:hypothetical protein [Methylobacterium aquaticum]BAQ50279.1 hypothetical protein Maq22A_3p50135 [Methylobacterium aquaticum]
MSEIIDLPMPAAAEPDPRLFQIVPFMKYDQGGRFTEDGKMGLAIIEAQQRAGERILINVLPDRDTEWFDGTVIVPRPVLDLPAALEAPVGGEAPAFELPACTLRFDGPVSVEYEHPGGPFSVGFTIPGTYTIKGEAFPAQAFTLTLTVTA